MDKPTDQHRNQLFGQLTIHIGLLTPDQLQSVSDDRESQSLGDALVARGMISNKLRGHIDGLVDEHMRMHGDDPEESLASLNATVSLQRGDTDATHHFASRIAAPAPTPTGDFAGYELLDQIGKGGMGVVYRARQIELNRTVALKLIKAGDLADAEDIQRFKAEAEAAANLDHPGIVPVYEVGESNGQHFFSMGFVEGDTLGDRLRDGPLAPRHAAELVKQISDAVAYAHSKQIIHRDLKPGNILLDSDGQTRITDFGLAKQMAADTELTATGQILGTPSYMPPEQATGSDTGPAADIYSIGAILYATTTGRPPHQAATPTETLLAVLNKDPVEPRTLNGAVPKDLETICLKCLSKDSRKRYSTADEVADELDRWLTSQPIKARRVGRMEKSWLWCKRRPVVAGLLATLFLVVTIGSAVGWERSNALFSEGLVNSLVNAEPSRVKDYLDQIEDYRWWTQPLLETRHASARVDSVERVYLGLALLRFDDIDITALKEALLRSDPRNFPVLRDELASHKEQLIADLWTVFRDESNEKRRFRAGLALARYVPDDDERWTPEDAKFLMVSLLGQVPEDQPLFRGFLVDVKERLYPELKRAFLDPNGKERQTLGAAKAFAEYALDDIGRIADVAAAATVDQYQVLYSALEDASPEPIHAALRPVVSEQPDDTLTPLDRVIFGKRRAGAAITLLRKGDREQIFDALRVTDDPESLTQFVHRCKERGVRPDELLECLEVADKLRKTKSGKEREIEDRVLFGVLLALGEFPLEDMPDSKSLIERLADWYANDSSSAIHGATGWLLRHWGQQELATKVDQTPVPYSPDRQWYTLEIKTVSKDALVGLPVEKKTHMTFVVIPAGTYTIGSPENEPERLHNEARREVTITRAFAVLDREVTWAEATMFDRQKSMALRNIVRSQGGWLPGLNEPWVTPHWYDSVSFCRWLTTQVGLGDEEQAYANPATLDKSKYLAESNPNAGGMPRDWPVDLHRPGFRLPTEAEWEIACRVQTRVSWSFGGDGRLMDRYGWFVGNSEKRMHAVRLQRPNLRGLFDMHGSAYEWCHDWAASYPKGMKLEDPKGPENGLRRVIRSGCWDCTARNCRSSNQDNFAPSDRNFYVGVRLVTVPPRQAKSK